MNIDKLFLLVYLHLIIVLVMKSMIVEGMFTKDAATESFRFPSSRLEAHPTKRSHLYNADAKSPSPKVIRRAVRLHHQCSNREVVVRGNITTGNNTDTYGNLTLETYFKYGTLTIRIRGSESSNYMCFNKRGRLKAKSEKRALEKGAQWESMCEFKEEPLVEKGNTYIYRSLYNPEWVLGFNQRGFPLSGISQNKTARTGRHRQNCFWFTKRRIDHSNKATNPRSHTPISHVQEHNRRLGRNPGSTFSNRRTEAGGESTGLSYPFQQQHHSLRHSKKSRRHRKLHEERTSVDR